MAKRKKLNKRVVILLVAFGVIIIAGVVVVGLRMLPKDAEASALAGDKLFAEGKAAFENGDNNTAIGKFTLAEKKYSEAVKADKANADYPYRMAELQWHWVRIRTITGTERSKRLNRADHWLTVALQRKGEHVPSLQLLCEIRWQGRVAPVRYIEAADKLLELDKDDDKTCYRRAVMKTHLIAADGKYLPQAYADFKKAINLKPDVNQYWQGMFIFLREHMPNRLDETFRKAIKFNPRNASMHVAYGEYLLGKWQDVQERKQRGVLKAGEEEEASKWKKQAMTQFEAAINSEPKNAIGRVAIGRFYLLSKDLQKARKELEAARALDDRMHNTHRMLVSIYEQLGEKDEMRRAIRKALETLPEIPADDATGQRLLQSRRKSLIRTRNILNYHLADTLLGMMSDPGEKPQKLLDEARDCLAEIDRLDPKFSGRAFLAARIVLTESRSEKTVEEAIKILEQARKDKIADSHAINLLVNLYLGPYPGKAEKMLESYSDSPSILVLRALLKVRYRQYAEATKHVERALVLDKNNAGAKNLQLALEVLTDKTGKLLRLPDKLEFSGPTGNVLSDAFVDYASRLWADNRRTETVAILKGLHAKLPNNQAVIDQLVRIYRAMKQPAEADKLIRKVNAAHKGEPAWQRFVERLSTEDIEKRFARHMSLAQQNNKDPFAKAVVMARICLLYGKGNEFLKHLQTAAKLKPENPQVVSWRFNHALAKKPIDWKLAEECVAIAVKNNIDGIGGRRYKAQLLMMRRKYPEAVALLKGILKEYPARKHERMLLGNCCLATGEIDKAEEAFGIVAEDDPSHVEAAIRMAGIMESTGRWQQFSQWVTRAYQLAPNDLRVNAWHMAIEERKVRNDQLEPFITKRLRKMTARPDDLRNILHLALLYERSKQFSKAEEFYSTFFNKSTDKLTAATVLGRFYVLRKRYADADGLMEELLSRASNNTIKSRTYVAYGNLLAGYNQQQALNAYDNAIKTNADNAAAYVAKARFLVRLGKIKEAADVLAEYTRNNPENLRVRKQLAVYHMELNRLNEADLELENLLRVNPEGMGALILRGVVASRKGELERALDFFARVLKIKPGYAEASLQRAEIFRLQRKDALAKRELRNAKGVTDNVVLATRFGTAWLVFGEFDEADRMFRSALAERPDYEPAIRGLLRLYFNRKEWSALRKELNKASVLFPNESYYLTVKANMYRQLGDKTAEISALAEAHKIAHDSPATLLNYMNGLIRAKQYSKALTVSNKYVGKPEYKVLLPAMRADAMAKLGKTTEADALFVSALKTAEKRQLTAVVNRIKDAYGNKKAVAKLTGWLKHRPKDEQLYFLLGGVQVTLKDLPGAIKSFSMTRDLATEPALKAAAWYQLGAVYQQMKKTADSEKAYLTALKFNPNLLGALNNLAYLYVDQMDRPDKAKPYAAKAAKLAPRNGNILDTYGWTLAKAGEYAQAQELLESAARLLTGGAVIYYHLGWVYEKTDKLNNALKQYRHARELADRNTPLYRQISDALKRVRSVIKSKEK